MDIQYNSHNLTLKRAKELCKTKFSKLPRMGYESEIIKDTIQVKGLYTRFPFSVHTVERVVYLQNNAGTFRIWEYISPNETC